MVQAASIGTLTHALSMAIAAASSFQISSITAAQRLQNESMKINDEMAKTAKKNLLNEKSQHTIATIVMAFTTVATIAMGAGIALDAVGTFEEGSFGSNIVKKAEPAIRVAGVIGGFGSVGALGTQAVYQGRSGSLEGEITREKAYIGAIQTATKRLTKTMSSTVQSEQTLATVSSEVISNNLAANTAR